MKFNENCSPRNEELVAPLMRLPMVLYEKALLPQLLPLWKGQGAISPLFSVIIHLIVTNCCTDEVSTNTATA